jgi:hypothetical protein
VLSPLHIATRGRLDGQYGIATRGLVVCPDIVPRFPVDALLRPEFVVGEVRELELDAVLRSMELHGDVVPEPDLVAALRSLDLIGELAGNELPAGSDVALEGLLVGLVRELGLHGAIRSLDLLAGVSERDIEGILGILELIGDVKDEPPHC